MRSIKVFTDRYPLIGPAVWLLTVEYFIVQLIAAAAWKNPVYSWRFNTISDLGNTFCGTFNGRNVCSPLHSLMNVAFVALGLLMASGSLLIYQEFQESRTSLLGFSLMAIAGYGTILVGIFPENTVPFLHIFGAAMPFLIGNISLVVLGLALNRLPFSFRVYTFLSGLVPFITLGFFVSHNYGVFDIGGLERVVAYPQTIWLILFGAYMTRSHFRSK